MSATVMKVDPVVASQAAGALMPLAPLRPYSVLSTYFGSLGTSAIWTDCSGPTERTPESPPRSQPRRARASRLPWIVYVPGAPVGARVAPSADRAGAMRSRALL